MHRTLKIIFFYKQQESSFLWLNYFSENFKKKKKIEKSFITNLRENINFSTKIKKKLHKQKNGKNNQETKKTTIHFFYFDLNLKK